jgi:hypothetical protein
LISVFPGLTNDTRRRLYLSTNLAGTASNGGYNRTLSNWGATFFPTNAKMYLVSASRPDFNLLLPANGTNAQGDNNNNALSLVTALEGWIKVVSNGVVAAPANLVDGWTNKGEFLHVRAIDLAPIFNEARVAQQKISEQEDKNLEEIARALVASIQANGQIPNPNVASTSASGGWVYLASTFSSLGQSAFQYSFPLVSSNERRFYLDTNIASLSLSTPAAGWPAAPAGPASLFIVSSSKQDLDLSCSANGPGANNSVTNSLNWLRGWTRSPSISVTDSVAAWTNRGEFLHVKSVDLQSLFCLVQLEDCRSPASASINAPGSGYINYGPSLINTNGVTISVSFTGSTNTNTIIGSASVISSPGKIMWSETSQTSCVASAFTNTIPVAGGAILGSVDLVFPATPSFAISTNSFARMISQNISFYILKGTRLQLGDSSLASLSSIIINTDSTFRFINGSWSQID